MGPGREREMTGIGRAVRAMLTAMILLAATGMTVAGESMVNPNAELKTPENMRLSPYTGYTREHWIEIAQKIISGILPYFSDESGMPELVGDPGETGHFAQLFDVGGSKEAFDRSLFLVAVYTAATGSDRVPGYDGSITEPYLREVRRGTDPAGPHYWGDHPTYDVFGTNLAMGIQLSPEFFWEPLDEKTRKNVLLYFKDLAHTLAYDCNHWHFHQISVPLLDRYGVASNREFLTSMFERLMHWYRGDGWFIDGGNRSFDLYNFWAFQVYNHALTRFDPGWKKQFGKMVETSTARFLESYPYFFGRDGGHIAWGRSTTYRFAAVAPVGWTVWNGVSTLPPGQARRIASGNLKYFWEHGCLSERGLLEPGFWGPNTAIAEPYIDRGSPYWALQGMISLIIPADDPFWNDPEQPIPADGAGGRKALPGAQMTVNVSPADGEARMYPVGQPFAHWGQWQRGEKYCQLAYSSYLGWCVTGAGGEDLGAGRNGISFDGIRWHFRERPEAIQVDTHHLISRETIPLPSPEEDDTVMYDFGEIITHTLVGNSGEVHVFWHTSAKPAWLYLGGYGISVPHGQDARSARGEGSLALVGGPYNTLMKVVSSPPGKLDWRVLEPREGWRHTH
ncbi:MAG: DUF2264 domain-containing protein, partial [Candidatus Glassbacteria bacterium]|nr:DUF2264 domain-containing protein [Candidatus Glassbacteria bacterium]